MEAPTRPGWYAVWLPSPGTEHEWRGDVAYCFGEPLRAVLRDGRHPHAAFASELLAGTDWLGPFSSAEVAKETAHALARRSA